MTIHLVTSNPGKAKELTRNLTEIAEIKALELKEIKEPDKGSVIEISIDKARQSGFLCRNMDEVDWTLSDDTGLYIKGNYPGIKIGRETKLKYDGDFSGWSKDFGSSKAIATTVLTLIHKNPLIIIPFTGVVHGRIARPDEAYPGGGFGFDPYFICSSNDKTLSQLDKEGQKDNNSPRGLAIKQLKDFLSNFL